MISYYILNPLAPTPNVTLLNKQLEEKQEKQQQKKSEEENKVPSQDITSLQQEENVSISGSNARLMVMKKLSRKSQVSERDYVSVVLWVTVTNHWGEVIFINSSRTS